MVEWGGWDSLNNGGSMYLDFKLPCYLLTPLKDTVEKTFIFHLIRFGLINHTSMFAGHFGWSDWYHGSEMYVECVISLQAMEVNSPPQRCISPLYYRSRTHFSAIPSCLKGLIHFPLINTPRPYVQFHWETLQKIKTLLTDNWLWLNCQPQEVKKNNVFLFLLFLLYILFTFSLGGFWFYVLGLKTLRKQTVYLLSAGLDVLHCQVWFVWGYINMRETTKEGG